jgi:hypothetical protein
MLFVTGVVEERLGGVGLRVLEVRPARGTP